jgi:hypothetical protein
LDGVSSTIRIVGLSSDAGMKTLLARDGMRAAGQAAAMDRTAATR